MLNIFFDTSPLSSGHSHRGIGTYTKQLHAALVSSNQISLVSDKLSADLIHIPFFDFFQHTLPFFKVKPTVITIHDVIPLQFPEFYPAGIKGTIGLWQQKLSLLGCNRIITDSVASKNEIVTHLGISNDIISVVPLAVSPLLSYQSLADQRKVSTKYNLPSSYILYVGDINYNKQIPFFLEAVSKLDNSIPVVLVGKNFRHQNIPEWQRITTSIKNLHLENKTIFVPNVESIEDLAAIYSATKVYVQPSIAEGFGLPILEAMQCYCPVVCFNQSSMAEVSGQHAVHPSTTSPSGLAEAISTVLSWSESDRKKWVLPAYSWAKTFSWEKTATATIQAYFSAVKSM